MLHLRGNPNHNLRISYHCAIDGFSILEAMIAAAIVAVVASASLTLYTAYSRSLQINRRENQIQAAIASDLSTIEDTNRRIICTTGTCTISEELPGEDDYFPDPTNEANVDYFLSLCSTASAPRLAESAVALINAVPQPALFSQLGITRQPAAVETYNTAPLQTGHRYVVSWTRVVDGQTTPIRQVTLTPTTAYWCP